MMDGVAGNPFPGLRPFEETEGHLFFGREEQVDELLGRLRRHRFVAVIGTSGSGKSSLVRAGLFPALRVGSMAGAGSRWRIVAIRPGNDPLRALALELDRQGLLGREGDAELRVDLGHAILDRGGLGLVEIARQARLGPDENLLVVVDQFEELFRYSQLNAEDGAAFVKLLLEAAAYAELPLYVAITMRSDFLGNAAMFRDLPERINDGLFLIPRMSREQLERAIVGPVRVAEETAAPRLVNLLLNDVGDDPDQLPVLQHALARTWEAWESDRAPGETIDIRHYAATGGLDAALDRHAESVYGQLTPELQTVAQRTFAAITELGSDNRGIRRPLRFGDLRAVTEASDADLRAVIEAFRAPGCSFLMPPAGIALEDATVVDLSHESLMRVWIRLQTWVSEEGASAQTYRRLAQDAKLHADGRSSLWVDPGLTIAEQWRDTTHPNAAWAERYTPVAFALAMEFLDAGIAAREREREERRRAEEARANAERERLRLEAEIQRGRADAALRLTKRTRIAAAAMAVIAAIAIALGVTSVLKAREAEAARVEADAARVVAEAETLAAKIVEFRIPASNAGLSSIVEGPDGALWFAEFLANKIGRITPAGQLSEFPLPNQHAPEYIVVGPDGNLWFTESLPGRIGRITPAGNLTEFQPPTPGDGYDPDIEGIVPGPDGALWFTEGQGANSIGRITTSGQIRIFTIPSPPMQRTVISDDGNGAHGSTETVPKELGVWGIAAGPDGNLWFTEQDANKIGRISTSGKIDEFALPATGNESPQDIKSGPDGALWFTERNGNKIGRITVSGQIAEFAVPTKDGSPFSLVTGPDGALWFTEVGGDKIGRMTPAGQVVEFPLPTPDGKPEGITVGPDDALWFTESGGNKIGRIPAALASAEFPLPSNLSWPEGIVRGPDGALWFTEDIGDKIGRMTQTGELSEFATPTKEQGDPAEITVGPDGAFWFTESGNGVDPEGNKIGRVTPAGKFDEFTLPRKANQPEGIALGPDGNLWFAEHGGNRIGAISTSGKIVEHLLPRPKTEPWRIVKGPDDALWFTENGYGAIGRMTPAGAVVEFRLPAPAKETEGLTAGPDGALWFTEFDGNAIGRISTAGKIALFPLPESNSQPEDIVTGTDGALWFTEQSGDRIGRITTGGQIIEFQVPTSDSEPYAITVGPDGALWYTEADSSKIGRLVFHPCCSDPGR